MLKNIKRIVLCGPAASGKDFFRKRLENERGLEYAVTVTTRPPRPGEEDGVDYHFLSQEEAERMKKDGEFVEWADFYKWTYGTPRSEFDEKELFIMTPTGLAQLSNEDRDSSLVMYFDIPEEVRYRRLLNREMAQPVDSRMKDDREQFEGFNDYDIRITNPEF